MTLISEIRCAIQDARLEPIFSRDEVIAVGIPDKHHNLSNYDKKNTGSSHSKVLASRGIGDTIYYTFHE